MKDKLNEYYKKRYDELSAELRARKKKVRWFVATEIMSFVAAVAVAVMFVSEKVSVMPFIFIFNPLFALFLVTKWIDRLNSRKTEKIGAKLCVYSDNLKYLNGTYSSFDDGRRYINPKHQYSFDMDIFGKDSLFQRICRTVTMGGADRLADILSSCALPDASVGEYREKVERRRKAIAELAEMEEWRTDFLSVGYKNKVHTETIRRALDETRKTDIPKWALSNASLALAAGSMTVFVVLVLFSVWGNLSADFVCIWTVVQLGASIGLSAKAIKMISKAVDRLSGSLKPYIALLELVSKTSFKEEENKRIVDALNLDGDAALASMKELKGILDALDRRANVLGLVIFNALAWNDLFLVRRYLRWQRRNMQNIYLWIDAVSDMDAMVSMATMRYNEPDSREAQVTDDDKVVYEAKELYHPFLGEKAVKNDFTVVDGNYYIITGANMAGKSTFLRSVGINYILAMCGMTVFADSLKVSVFSLFSSMRTSDDLVGGISYFNAELLRLKLLLDNVRQNRHTLIILDEILKGTNSLDKLNGSRMFLEAAAKLPVSGIIATHDLELSKMADAQPERFHNYCFEIKLADNITYTYKITPGVARNQNATYLLKGILED